MPKSARFSNRQGNSRSMSRPGCFYREVNRVLLGNVALLRTIRFITLDLPSLNPRGNIRKQMSNNVCGDGDPAFGFSLPLVVLFPMSRIPVPRTPAGHASGSFGPTTAGSTNLGKTDWWIKVFRKFLVTFCDFLLLF